MKTMLYSLLITLLIFTSVNATMANGETEMKRANPFYISKRTIDTTLAEGSSQFRVTIYDNNGEKYTRAVNIGMNDQSSYKTPDITGLVKLNATKGKYKLYFHVSGYEEVITDSIKVNDQEIIEATVRLYTAYRDIRVKKPVIYVYPEETMDVNIQLEAEGKLSFTYPEYNEGWNFTATPEGTISMNDKEYNYLFWESEMPEYALDKTDNTGFLVATDTLLSFLENSLDQMGFNSKESADFITFWYPQMMVNEKNHVQFIFNESCDAYAKLNISPKPDHIYRVGMIWKNATTDFIPGLQTIPTVNRDGFTVIEWGGMESELLFINEN